MRRLRPHWSWVALAAILLLATVFIYLEARGLTFRRDDWHMILTRREDSLEALLRPHNGHLLALHALAYKSLLETFGIQSYAPFQLLALGLHGLVVVLIFAYARRRVGPLAALAVAVLFMVPGTAAHDVLWTFQIGFLGSVAAAIGMLLALDRRDVRGDAIASLLLLVSLSWSGIGLVAALAATVELVASRSGWPRAGRVLAAPFALFGLWYLAYGGDVAPALVPATEVDVEQPLLDNLLAAPAYLLNAAGAAFGSALGVPSAFWPVLALVGIGLVVAFLIARGRVRPRIWSILALPVGYWASLAVARAHFNDFADAHYLYPGVAFSLVAAVELLRDFRPPRRTQAVMVVALAAILASNLGAFRIEARALLRDSGDVLARLSALEAAHAAVDPEFRPVSDPGGSAPDIVADRYFAAIDDYGSPAPSLAELERMPDELRRTADATLLAALGVRLVPAGIGGPPGGACQTLRPLIGGETLDVEVPPAGLTLEAAAGAPVALSARRLADTFALPFTTLAGGRTALLSIPPDGVGRPWQLRIQAGQSVRACNR